jgi:hypothetical protein
MPIFSRGPAKPARPVRPVAPPKPESPQAVVVRIYKASGLGSEKKVAKLFERDAREWAKKGYVPSQTAAQGPKAATMLMGGIGLLAGGTLTVTYVLSPESQARLAAQRAAYEAWKRDEGRLMAEWQTAMRAWEAECARIDREHAAQKAAEAEAKLEARAAKAGSGSGASWTAPAPTPEWQSPQARVTRQYWPVAQAGSPQPEPAAVRVGPGEIAEVLAALESLRAVGLITDEEYYAKRQEALARLVRP